MERERIGAGIGAGVGMAIGGPIGAGIGAWVGSGFGNNKQQFSAQENQTIFFVALCSMLAKMAKADRQHFEKSAGVFLKDL